MIPTPTLIIGAGPAGLAVAGRLRARGSPFEIIEKGEHVAESWHHHYDRLQLHTVKELSQLPGRAFPDHYPRYVPRSLLVDYYRNYAASLDIKPRFRTEAVSVRREEHGWLTRSASGPAFRSDAVVVATGVNRIPNRPSLPGEASFKGVVMHSRAYRNPEPFEGKRVLVVGMGNTGAEIALDLCERAVPTALSVRGPVNVLPRDVLGRPTQLTAMTLARLPFGLGSPVGSVLRRLTMGDLSRYGIPTPDIAPIEQLRIYGKTPVIDLGTVARIKTGEIRVHGAIETLRDTTVCFADGVEEPFDAIVLATGYRPRVEDLLGDVTGLLDGNGAPGVVVGTGIRDGLFFIGFDNYRPGGILGTVQEESRIIANQLAKRALAGSQRQR